MTAITTVTTTVANLYRWRRNAQRYDRARAAELVKLGIIKL